MTKTLQSLLHKIKTLGFLGAVKYVFERVLKNSQPHLGQIDSADAEQSQKLPASEIHLPSQKLMESIGASDAASFLEIGETWANLIFGLAIDQARVLDIGCGCGRIARFLAPNEHIKSYVGFDTINALIEWNHRFILPHCRGDFHFKHLDIYSKAYNPKGQLHASQVSFPAADNSIDIAFAASLFTHLLEKDAIHYLDETMRCLKPGGMALISIHVVRSTKARFSGNEFRMEVEENHFVKLAEKAGLTLKKNLGDVNGQTICLFEKKSA
ncbi:MAG: class I SAM-dependent methyltransferase [Pseudohongiellaceae bacterium]